jgi:hypothetical protein
VVAVSKGEGSPRSERGYRAMSLLREVPQIQEPCPCSRRFQMISAADLTLLLLSTARYPALWWWVDCDTMQLPSKASAGW